MPTASFRFLRVSRSAFRCRLIGSWTLRLQLNKYVGIHLPRTNGETEFFFYFICAESGERIAVGHVYRPI